MTSHSRCAKDSALVRHKILSSSRTSGVGGRVVDLEFRSFFYFLGNLFSQCC